MSGYDAANANRADDENNVNGWHDAANADCGNDRNNGNNGYNNREENVCGDFSKTGGHGQQLLNEELRLEDILAQVEQCISQLENPQISLEDSFRYYEEGVRKLKLCNDKVAQIEQRMLVINSRGELEEF